MINLTTTSGYRRLKRFIDERRQETWWRNWWMALVFWFASWFLSLMSADVRSEIISRGDPANNIANDIFVWTPLLDHLLMLLPFACLFLFLNPLERRAALPLNAEGLKIKLKPLNRFVVIFLCAVALGVLLRLTDDFLYWLGGYQGGDWWNSYASRPARARIYIAEVVVVAPAVEETIFRGLLFSPLERAWGRWAAALATALPFLAIHWIQAQCRLGAIISYLLFGVVLGLVRAVTGSIWPGWVSHVTANLILGIRLLKA